MNVLEFTSVLSTGAFAAGLVGSLTGLGGGVVIVPLLTIAMGVDIRYAVGASLVSVIATSSGAAAAYVREGYSNIRLGMLLEIATSLGALSGAFLAAFLPTATIAVIFGLVLLHSAYLSFRNQHPLPAPDAPPDRIAGWFRLGSEYPGRDGAMIPYRVCNVPGGFALMIAAGVLSGLLGIGSGALKVIAMDRLMQLPFKVSTTTSNFMIGVTAAASAGVYFSRGYIDPGLAMPVMLGVLAGALAGARLMTAARTRFLRIAFAGVILALAVEMIYNGLRSRI